MKIMTSILIARKDTWLVDVMGRIYSAVRARQQLPRRWVTLPIGPLRASWLINPYRSGEAVGQS